MQSRTPQDPVNGNDLRQRYAEALARRLQADKVAVPESVTTTSSLTPGVYDLADAVLAVRDEELESARAAAQAELRGGLDCARLAVQWQQRAERAEEECAAVRQQLVAARMALKGAEREAEAVSADRESTVKELRAAEAAIARVRAHHQPTAGLGYDCDEDDTPESYGDIAQVCTSCGTSGEYGVRWPCPTIRALDGPAVSEEQGKD